MVKKIKVDATPKKNEADLILASLSTEQVAVELATLMKYPRNPRRGNVSRVKESIKENGYYPTIFVQKSTRYVIKGNHTFQALAELNADGRLKGKFDKIIVNMVDVDDDHARRIVLADNRSADDSWYDNDDLYFNLKVLEEESQRGLVGSGFTMESLDALARMTGHKADIVEAEEKKIDEDTGREETKKGSVPDAKWPTDNDYDIPVLDTSFMADYIDLPILAWGSQRGRKGKTQKGTYHFYTTDDILDPLWKDPTPPINTKAVTCTEINYTCYDQTPFAEALHRIYKKRWIARFWQSKGLRIVADLNVAPKWLEINWMGIPHGWKTYSVRGYSMYIGEGFYDMIEEQAIKRRGSKDIVMLVIGGADNIKRYCAKKNWIWIPEELAVARGKYLHYADNPHGEGLRTNEDTESEDTDAS